jgi:hypothetical protein
VRPNVAGDVRRIIQDFGEDITVTDPFGKTAVLSGLVRDIGQAIDPGTGLLVSGRFVNVSIARGAFVDAGFEGLPRHVGNEDRMPWKISIVWRGETHVFVPRETDESNSMGFVNLKLGPFSNRAHVG